MSWYKLIFLGLLAPINVWAQDSITLSAHRNAQKGFGNPSVTVHAHVQGNLTVTLRCGGKSYGQNSAISPGTDVTLELTGLPMGQHNCSGKVALRAADGTSGEMPLNLTVAMLEPLKLTVALDDLDLDGNMLRLSSTRPLSHVSVDVLGADGTTLGSGETPVSNVDRAELQWSQQPGEVIKLIVKGKDIYNLPGQLELSPWAYDIPHEDIVFATGKSEITSKEEPKIEKAWQELTEVVEKYGRVVEVKLYIAGYTDTVGPASSNQALSLNRARSIARWFQARGFKGPIHYQGLGESALAVHTADEVAEAANRRAAYILAAQKPAISDAIPTSNWTRLQ